MLKYNILSRECALSMFSVEEKMKNIISVGVVSSLAQATWYHM
jgi:hypothetical protein